MTLGRRASIWLLLALVGAAGVSASCGSAPETAPGGAVSPALARIRSSVSRTESTGSAHFVTTAVTSATLNGKTLPTQQIDTAGDIQFDGAKVSLTTQVVTPDSTTPPTSKQIAIGKDYYVREGDLPGPSGRWSKGTTKQDYPYLGVVEPAGLANARGPVRVVGSKMIDGQRTTEYALTMAGAIHVLSAPGGRTATLKVRPFTLDIWLDMGGRIVATGASVVASEGNKELVRSTTSTHLSGFGEPLDIKAPAT